MNSFERASLFLLVVDQGSLAGAARQKGISPSVVSKRLAELEQVLGVQLLRRTTRRMSLTEAGEQFYQQMRHLDGQWQSLLDETASLGQEAKGVLTIAAPQPVLTRVLLAVVNEFQQQNPQIEIVLQAADYNDLPRSEADITLCRQLETLDTATTIGVPLCDYSNSLFAAPEYLEKSEPKNTQALVDYACLAYGLTSPNTWTFSNGESIAVNSSLLTNNTEVIIQSAIAAHGIAYIPAMIIQQELADKKLQPILPEVKSRNFQLWAYYQKLDYVPVKIRVFLDYLKTVF
ncbi:MAG: LysR family transcriptional regulator [Oleispira sp.]